MLGLPDTEAGLNSETCNPIKRIQLICSLFPEEFRVALTTGSPNQFSHYCLSHSLKKKKKWPSGLFQLEGYWNFLGQGRLGSGTFIVIPSSEAPWEFYKPPWSMVMSLTSHFQKPVEFELYPLSSKAALHSLHSSFQLHPFIMHHLIIWEFAKSSISTKYFPLIKSAH